MWFVTILLVYQTASFRFTPQAEDLTPQHPNVDAKDGSDRWQRFG
jgi:hypothetical protein